MEQRITGWRGEAGGDFQSRMELKAQRDTYITREVDKEEVVSANLMTALLGFPQTPKEVYEVAKLMERLAKQDGLFQYTTQLNVHYGVSFTFSLMKKGAKRQLPHRDMASWRRATFDRIGHKPYKTGDELRAALMKTRNAIIADDLYRFPELDIFCEDETGSHTVQEMVEKALQYHKQLDHLKRLYGSKRFRVIWNLARSPHVNGLLRLLDTLPGKGLHLVTNSSLFNPSQPFDFHTPVFLSPLRPGLHSLLEDEQHG